MHFQRNGSLLLALCMAGFFLSFRFQLKCDFLRVCDRYTLNGLSSPSLLILFHNHLRIALIASWNFEKFV